MGAAGGVKVGLYRDKRLLQRQTEFTVFAKKGISDARDVSFLRGHHTCEVVWYILFCNQRAFGFADFFFSFLFLLNFSISQSG